MRELPGVPVEGEAVGHRPADIGAEPQPKQLLVYNKEIFRDVYFSSYVGGRRYVFRSTYDVEK